MLMKRVVTALVGALAAGYIINYGQWVYASTVAILALLAWREFCQMFSKKKIILWNGIGSLGILILLGCAWFGNSQEIIMLVFAMTLFILVRTVVFPNSFNIVNASVTLLGILYIGLSFSYLLLLRFTDASNVISSIFGNLTIGTAFLWVTFLGTWANDTFAFFVGSHFGRHKLCPQVSPGKTIEGAIGGVIGSILIVCIAGSFFNLSFLHSLIVGLFIGIVGPLGDLTESAIKRFTGVKDSGNLLPGHGGVLDRFDSIMFAVPTVYYYLHAFIL